MQTGYPLKIINDAAHNVNVDKAEEVNDCIRAFLSDITRYGENPALDQDWDRIMSHHPNRILYAHANEKTI